MDSLINTPELLSIDPCTHCQLSCPGCPNMDLGHPPGMGWGLLRFNDFKKLLDENNCVKQIEFHCFGEAFLNKELLLMLRYGSERGITFSITSANFNQISDELLEALVDCRVDNITVAIDGATEATYAIYRRGGNFNRVMANLHKVIDYKKLRHSELPRIIWLWVVFGHNQHEIPLAKRMASELGVEFFAKMQWNSSYSPIKHPEALKLELGWIAPDRESYREQTGREYMSTVCYQLWQAPKINWDGRVIGCCWTQEGFGGNAFSEGYSNAINNDKIRYARDMLTGQAPARDDVPCSSCTLYLDRAKRKKWITLQELESTWYYDRQTGIEKNRRMGDT